MPDSPHSELLVGDDPGVQFGDCVLFRFEQMIIGEIYIICTYTFFFAYSVVQEVVTGYRSCASR